MPIECRRPGRWTFSRWISWDCVSSFPRSLPVAYERSREVLAAVLPHTPGVHIHWAMPHFFGVLPLCLMVWALFSRQSKRTWFWLGYVLVSLSLILYLPPFDTLVRLLSFPAYHAFSLQIFLPVGVSMLAAYAGMRLEARPSSFVREEKARALFYFTLGSLLLFAVLIWLARYRFTEPMVGLKLVGAGTVAGLAGFFLCLERASFDNIRRFFWIPALGLLIAAVGMRSSNGTFLSHLKLLLLSLSTTLMFFGPHHRRQRAVFAGVVLAVALWPWAKAVHELPEPRQDLILVSLGILKSLMVVAIFSLAIRARKVAIYPLCLALLVFDQLPAMKIHSHIALNPFSAMTPYPAVALPKTLDLENYRVNRPHLMLHLPIYEALWGKNRDHQLAVFRLRHSFLRGLF